MVRLRLPIPYHKAVRLILPCGLLLAGITIFIGGLVRTHNITGAMPKTVTERRMVKTQNDYLEWWVGLPVIVCAIIAICSVFVDKPLLFKFSVLTMGTCFVVLLYSLSWDIGEFSWVSRDMSYYRELKSEGFDCSTKEHKFNYSGHPFIWRECACAKGTLHEFGLFTPYSCEILKSTYYLTVIMGFALASAIGLALFTLSSFVLILKRISQITTALHLDEKPLSEDFSEIRGDLYIES
ncbi:uncharacterized protein LOC114537620 [Dendronephthya gigantea]|uniref:uncharacterized protein LOC114537620 n=1 Tax=Dendronephthya gigantea TaxID=151771 RepID=UPI00106D68F9|nr:uncharacterized protein LOC114537620 [Dendronephthya gigantea]